MNMKFAFSSLACPQYTVSECIALAQKYQFDGVELRTLENTTELFNLPDFSPARLFKTSLQLQEALLAVPVIGTSVSFAIPGHTHRERQLAEIRKFCTIAQALHCPYLRVFGGSIPEGQIYSQVLERDIDGYTEAAEIAASYGVVLLLETHDDFSTASALLPLVQKLNGKVGVIWDILHPYRWGEDMEDTFCSLAPYVRHVHIKDSLCYSRETFDIVLPGQGNIPIFKAVQLLANAGYGGYLSFEWEKHWHPEIQSAETALPCYMEYMKQVISQI